MATITVWRVVSESRATTAYSGEKAERYGGRFNSAGVPVAYAAGSLSLAVLEAIVQAGRRERLKQHVCVQAVVSDRHIVDATALPSGWNHVPSEASSREYGDAWLSSASSLVLRVPSVVIPQEWNYLINPRHPSFGDLKTAKPIPFPLDPRLAQR